ncbi:ABC transporter ATP-binding protein [Flavimobilis sp. GY10621]|uniref:ABC transporter ATP-binding protein n=1 Tax=Flavimobilis rhizosphaerae TaxID=2775421 RepID=A0ABR9DSJ3_9MICO|nr:ABC transporter ATP-binding protein [Flavimobilis rhizosphaerae]MBD9699297.1 ABC transporter ATP-binding protein [Flavimobilis rhizosphaerae]
MTAVLEARDLTFAYRRGAPPVIDGLTHAFAPGALTTVTGPSGSGKSTLLYVLALMLRPTSGQVRWDDDDASALPDAARARLRAGHAGFVFQDAVLDPARTILDNVREAALFAGMPDDDARERALELCDRFGVGHRVDHRPGEISGGQAQRVALCRALLTRPRVVFGDEPTGNLDGASARIVWDALRAHARAGATVVVATHDERLADESDERVVLS